MKRCHHCRLVLAAALLTLGAGCWSPVRAQATGPGASAGASAGARRASAASVPHACRAELARLCPEIDGANPQGRSAAICLKPFKTSLSLPCRRAVRGVFG